ncbi:hypothetical protein FGE12_04440 [Aggregicoccus sp. 17bor-14]|nr:hypothetical protein [Simulacricoccus sp. 17bor-14]MRI87410.1 hypothetical protein [Aggregicoccus sp. 17bor-14]
MGSSRVVGLGGAYVGIAEGAEGFNSNVASVAHRAAKLDRDWDWGFTLSWLAVPFTNPEHKDLDNDGQPDDALEQRQLLGGVQLQYRGYGLGFTVRNSHAAFCAVQGCGSEGRIDTSLTTSLLAGGFALGQDDFLMAFGIYAAEARFGYLGETWRYGGTGLAFDFLFRPHGRSYRVGAAVRPEVVGKWRPRSGQVPFIAGQQLFSAVVTPGLYSFGASWRLGEGKERYNRLSPAARRQLAAEGEETPEDADPTQPPGRWMLSAQLDVIDGVDQALGLSAFTQTGAQDSVGSSLLLQPRFGVEHETLVNRLRLRLGTFVEPSPFKDSSPRPHLTGGFEVFVLRYWEDWSVTASFDVARRFTNLGLSVGFWQ